MNLSGESVVDAVNFYKVDPEEDVIIIYDDIDLDVGKLRIRAKGSAGGHNGMKNIIAHLGTQVFPRTGIWRIMSWDGSQKKSCRRSRQDGKLPVKR